MSAGARFPTVVAKPVGKGVAAVVETRADRDTETVLRAVSQTQGASPTDLARSLGWTYEPNAAPNNVKAARILKRLLKEKLVIERLGVWCATQMGDKEFERDDLRRPR